MTEMSAFTQKEENKSDRGPRQSGSSNGDGSACAKACIDASHHLRVPGEDKEGATRARVVLLGPS